MSESAGLDEENVDFSMVKTSFVLTEEGKKHVTEIADAYWKNIEQLKAQNED